MKLIIRWLVAGLVTVVAFAVATWICGTLIMPLIMKNDGIRWGVATALGVAVAALAALWGHSFAALKQPPEPGASQDKPATAPKRRLTGSGSTHNKISGGTFHGTVTQGRDISGPVSSNVPPPSAPGPGTRG